MIHPNTEVRFIDEEVGYGVFAKVAIPRGTLTWVKDQLDREFSPEALLAFDVANREILDRYSYRNSKGHYVFCWDHTRFMNHSAEPNCLLTPYGFEIAVRDIAENEELTNDYGSLNIIEPFVPRPDGSARERILQDDLARHSADWDQQIAAAVVFSVSVEQPLLGLLAPATWEEIREVAEGKRALRSTSELLFRG